MYRVGEVTIYFIFLIDNMEKGTVSTLCIVMSSPVYVSNLLKLKGKKYLYIINGM